MLHQTRIVFPRQVEADNGEQIALDAQVWRGREPARSPSGSKAEQSSRLRLRGTEGRSAVSEEDSLKRERRSDR